MQHHRPISLTLTLCRDNGKTGNYLANIFRRKNNLLNNIQCGFRKGRSTIDHTIRLQDIINKYNNNNGYTVTVIIDYRSAFDMMWRIIGNIFNFIKTFLQIDLHKLK